MKRIIFFCILLISIGHLGAQNLNDLVKYSDMEIEKFELSIVEKGFEFHKLGEDILSKSYCFIKNNQEYICKYIDHNPKGERYISYQCLKDKYYQLKKDGISKGMQFISTRDQPNNRGYYSKYKYKNHFIEFWVAQGSGENSGLTIYEINVSKKSH